MLGDYVSPLPPLLPSPFPHSSTFLDQPPNQIDPAYPADDDSSPPPESLHSIHSIISSEVIDLEVEFPDDPKTTASERSDPSTEDYKIQSKMAQKMLSSRPERVNYDYHTSRRLTAGAIMCFIKMIIVMALLDLFHQKWYLYLLPLLFFSCGTIISLRAFSIELKNRNAKKKIISTDIELEILDAV